MTGQMATSLFATAIQEFGMRDGWRQRDAKKTCAARGAFHSLLNSLKTIRAADAKEVGVGNPAEETYRHPNQIFGSKLESRVLLSTSY